MRVVRTRNGIRGMLDGIVGRIAFIPTMGNLHAGHLKLMKTAGELGDTVVASIFVNPLQFGEDEDYTTYPRTFDEDCAALEAAGVDVVFAPGTGEMYPDGVDAAPRIAVPRTLSGTLEGESRPGHFDGVATVVARLFDMVRPTLAVFGEKDYQQLLVIRWLVAELALPVEIVAGETVREADGLAMSSRNQYLSADERKRAPAMYRAMRACAAALREGAEDYAALESEGHDALEAAGFRPDYFAIRRADDLSTPRSGVPLMVLAAGWLGKARLIDNLRA